MAIFTKILENALKSKLRNRGVKFSESAGLPIDDEEDVDISAEDIFDDESPDSSSDFFSLEADTALDDIEFDEDSARSSKGDMWFTELRGPVEEYLKKTSTPVFLEGDDEIDKASLETALTELFKHLGVSTFSGNIVEDGSIKISKKPVGELKEAEVELKEVDGVEEDIFEEDFEKETDPSLQPMNDADESENSSSAEILSMDVEWDGTSVGVGDIDIEYAEDDSDEEDDSSDEVIDDDDEEDGDDDDEDEEEDYDVGDDEMTETLSAEKILELKSFLDDEDSEDVMESIDSDGGVSSKDVKQNPSLKSGSYDFNNGADVSSFEDGVDNLTSVDNSISASGNVKSGDYFYGSGKFDGDATEKVDGVEDPKKLSDSTVKPKVDDFIPNTEEIVSSVEKEGIREEFDFDDGGEQKNVGDDLVMSEEPIEMGENEDLDFVEDSVVSDKDELEGLTEFSDERESILPKSGDPEVRFIDDNDKFVDDLKIQGIENNI